MTHYNLISSKVILGELNVDFNIHDSGLLSEVPRHVARALELMELHGYFKLTYSKHTLEEYRVPLPCDNKYLVAAFVNDGETICRIPLKGCMADANSFFGIPTSDLRARVDSNYLITETERGEVAFIYYSIPKDEEGMPMVPDNAFVLEALPYFLIYKLSLGGYKHPVITLDMAEEKWNQKYPRARNAVNFPSVEEMMKFTQSNTFPYYDRLLCLDESYGNVGDDGVPVFLSGELIADESEITVTVKEITNIIQIPSEDLGWIQFTNLAFTSSVPYTGSAGIITVPIGNDIVDSTQATTVLLTAVNDFNEIEVGNLGDAYIGRLDFKMRNNATLRDGLITLETNNGIVVPIVNASFITDSNALTEKSFSIVLPFAQLNSVSVVIKMDINGDFEMYDINLYLNKVGHGNN